VFTYYFACLDKAEQAVVLRNFEVATA